MQHNYETFFRDTILDSSLRRSDVSDVVEIENT